MDNPESSSLTQALYTLPKLPLAEDVGADLLLAYRDRMFEEGGGRSTLLANYAWNDLELGFALRDKAFVDAAFNALHELDESPSADLRRRPFLDVRMVLATEIPFRYRLEPTPMGKKKMAQTYRQVGALINTCWSLIRSA